MRKKINKEKPKEYIVFSEYGYFCGLAFGGEPQWSMKVEDAKPLNHINKFHTLKVISGGKELMMEYV